MPMNILFIYKVFTTAFSSILYPFASFPIALFDFLEAGTFFYRSTQSKFSIYSVNFVDIIFLTWCLLGNPLFISFLLESWVNPEDRNKEPLLNFLLG